MYKDRIPSPHHLSYSAVTSYQTSSLDSSVYDKYQPRDPIQKMINNQRSSTRGDNNSDLAFLRNTVGPISTSQNSALRINENRKFDPSLRQTMNITTNVHDFVKVKPQNTQKRTSRAETVGVTDFNSKNEYTNSKKDDRLEKIMDKYEKKNETKQALKLLEELKQLKKKQEELKKQRKNDISKQQDSSKRNTGGGYEPTSPINFSKKNKVDYYTPTYEKSQSTNVNSPQNQNYFINQKNSNYQNSQNPVIKVNNSYNIPSQSGSLSSPLQGLSFSTKSSSNLRTYYEPTSKIDQESSRSPFKKVEKKDYLSNSTVTSSKYDKYDSKYDKYDKPSSSTSSYQPSSTSSYSSKTSNVLTVTTRQNTSKSPFSKYQKESKYSASQFNGTKSTRLDNYVSSSYGSTNLKDVFAKSKVTINDFILGKNLGQGKFGTVFQAFDKRTKSLYALKKIPKSMIKSHWMIDQFILEVKIQHYLNHPNILALHGYFDDAEHVYLMLEYMEEGTLFLHLKKNTTLNERQAATKIKEIASAIQYLHQNGIAHRDLKPQNIVMSHGVCKLCDFGWATVCDQRRKTYCGTFDYAAPQILEGEQYDMSVDLWCLGILAYEVLAGKAPFYHISRKQTMKKIMNCENEKINYPHSMSYEAKSFIEQLLKRNPDQRLKSEDLLKHPFIQLADK